MRNSKKEFKELVYRGIKVQGVDELSSKLIATLYSEPNFLTLEELSKKTEYSFSAVSASMKILDKAHAVKRIKKSGSKKIYFTVERDFIKLILDSLVLKIQQITTPAIQKIPSIINLCKQEKSEDSKEILKIIEEYHQQMIVTEKIIAKMIDLTEEVQRRKLK